MDLATVDKLLTTTRTVRKRLNLTRPVEPEIIQQCLEIAIQAPTGGNVPRYHFVVVTDPAKRLGLAELYRKAFFEAYMPARMQQSGFAQTASRFIESATYLAEHLHEVPVHILPCVGLTSSTGRENTRGTEFTNILPAAWSLMLALRARGIGAAWTTIHTRYEHEAAALLGIPDNIRQAALLPVAYFTGEDFKPAKRVPARERTYWDSWGQTR
jgi:nitroreductase